MRARTVANGDERADANELVEARSPVTPQGHAAAATLLRRMAGDAFNDGSAGEGLGSGDDVFDANGRVIPAFSPTPEGVVAAALYELHRGDRRSIQDILADDTRGRVARGPEAARERGDNQDAADTAPIGGSGRAQIRPIAAYKRALGLGRTQPW